VEAVYRFWSVVPGLVAVALVAWWAWRRVGPAVSVAVVMLATVSPVHLFLTPQARGYGLALLAGGGMLVAAVRATDRGRHADVAWFAVFSAVGIWTLPSFVLPFGAQALVLLRRRDVRRPTLLACGAVAASSLLFYAPLLGAIARSSDQ